jgi:hypothetical protein
LTVPLLSFLENPKGITFTLIFAEECSTWFLFLPVPGSYRFLYCPIDGRVFAGTELPLWDGG